MPGTKNPNNPSRFKKGQSGNPKGGSRKARELKGLSRLSHKEVVELGSQILEGSLDDLARIRDEPNASVHKIWLATLVIDAISNKNYRAYHALLDRLVGKPREHAVIEHTGADGGPIETRGVEVSEESMREELLRLQAARRELG